MRRWFTYHLIIVLLPMLAMAQVDEHLIIARNTGMYALWNGDTLRVMGFTQSLSANVDVPGPTLILTQGDSVKIDLWNVSQGAPHTIHLHGLDVDQQNDGVPHLSFDVAHMKHGYYNFIAPHAGTYIYHCHVVSPIHVQAGMYGLIIVKPPDGSNTTWEGGYAYHAEQSWMMSEMDPDWHTDAIIEHAHDTTVMIHQHALPYYDPTFFLVNGKAEQQVGDDDVKINTRALQTYYLRVANIGNYGNRVILPSGLNTRTISSDGRPLPQEESSDTVMVFPGERYGVLLEPTAAFADSATIEYFDLNTQTIKNTQRIPVQVEVSNPVWEYPSSTINLKCYPNPSAGLVQIDILAGSTQTATLALLNLQGQYVGNTKQVALHPGYNHLTWDLPEIATGIYWLKLETSQGHQTIRKLILTN